ncbi:MAG: peroxiredoxin-like family protein [Pseudomonadota bacterium]
MYKPAPLTPAEPVPYLDVALTDGSTWSLAENAGENFTLINFYRGLHCPKCRDNLKGLEEALPGLAEQGVSVLAVSMDPPERGSEAKDEWGLAHMPMAHSLTLEQAKAWGLHISSGRGKTSTGHEETKVFNEPGTFLVRADGTLYASWVQTVPFGRPEAADLLAMIKFVNEKDYPPRGTHTDV